MANFVVLYQLVDRILQQKARRQAAEKAKLEETEKSKCKEAERVRSEAIALFISNLPEMMLHYIQTKIPITQTNIPLPPINAVITNLSLLTTQGTTSVEQLLAPKRSRLTSAIHNLGNFLRRNGSDAGSSRSISPTPGAFVLAQPGPEPSRELVRSPQPDLAATPLPQEHLCWHDQDQGRQVNLFGQILLSLP